MDARTRRLYKANPKLWKMHLDEISKTETPIINRLISQAMSDPNDSAVRLEIGVRFLKIEDFVRAQEWLEDAAHKGERDAMYFLAKKVPLPKEKSFTWLTRAADNGDLDAMIEIGQQLAKQKYASLEDLAQSEKYFRKAIKRGETKYFSDLVAVLMRLGRVSEILALKQEIKSLEQKLRLEAGFQILKRNSVSVELINFCLDLLKDEVNENDPEVLFEIAKAYNGLAMSVEASTWMKRAADAGNLSAQYWSPPSKRR